MKIQTHGAASNIKIKWQSMQVNNFQVAFTIHKKVLRIEICRLNQIIIIFGPNIIIKLTVKYQSMQAQN